MALIKNISDFKIFVGDVNRSNLTPGTFLPDVDAMEQDYIVPVLGDALYADLLSKYNDGIPTWTVGDASHKLWLKVGAALGQLTMYSLIISLASHKSDAGVMMKANTEKGEMPVAKWLLMADKIGYLNKGLAAIDRLYDFLDKNSTIYTLWASSDERTKYKSLFVQNTIAFNAAYGQNINRRTFERLYQVMQLVETQNIKKYIGDDLFSSLKAKLLTPSTLTDEEKYVISQVQIIIAYFTIAQSAKILSFYLSNGAFTVVPALPNDVQISDMGYQKPHDADCITFIQSHDATATQLAYDLKNYLNSTASSSILSIYFNSVQYTEWKKELTPINNSTNTIFTF